MSCPCWGGGALCSVERRRVLADCPRTRSCGHQLRSPSAPFGAGRPAGGGLPLWSMAPGRFAKHGWPSTGEALLVAAVCVGLTPLLEPQLSDDGGRDFNEVAAAPTVVACGPIAFRRSVPVVAAVVALSVALLGVALTY